MILTDRQAGRLVVTLNRPEKANALTADMLRDLVRIIREGTANEDISTLVLTGAGNVFSAGADLDEIRATNLATSPLWEDLSSAIAGTPIPTIAALNGSLAGGAMGMVLACDIRIAVPSAKFFYPVMKLGVLPQPSDPGRLAKLVGPARAKLMLLGAQRWTSETALGFGLIDVIEDDPLQAAMTLSDAACAGARSHAVAVKAMLSSDRVS
jgi:enoyl-CoA hydratase/carnithine racemase